MTRTEATVLKCIRRCYRDARRGLRTENDLLREGLRILDDGVDSKLLRVSRNKLYEKGAWKAAEGYREKTNHGIRVTIRGEAFKGWFHGWSFLDILRPPSKRLSHKACCAKPSAISNVRHRLGCADLREAGHSRCAGRVVRRDNIF